MNAEINFVDGVLAPNPDLIVHTSDDLPAVHHVLHRDYETRSRMSLKLVGAHRYAADSSTEILCAAYAVDDDPVRLWLPGDPIPSEFIEAASDSSWSTCAHGDHFESAIEQHVLAPRHGWPLAPLERHRCTMAMSLAAGLPARLDKVADALELTHRKDATGERLMHQMSKPRRAHKDEDPHQVHWYDDQERLDRLYGYCRQDVEVEREIHASTKDPSTWTDYATALAAVEAGHADGISYILTEEDPFAAIDIDNCRHLVTCSVDVWAQNFLDVGRHSYSEITPSGTGCRIWGFAEGEPLNRKFTLETDGKPIAAELFRRTNKALTVTGYTLNPAIQQLVNIDKVIKWAVAWGERRKAAAAATTAPAASNGFNGGGCRYTVEQIEAIIRNGAPTGSDRSALFHTVVGHLSGCGWDAERILTHLAQFPDGVGAKYILEERLAAEIARSLGKFQANELPLSGNGSWANGWEAKTLPQPDSEPSVESEQSILSALRVRTSSTTGGNDVETHADAPIVEPELDDDRDEELEDDTDLSPADPDLPPLHAHGDPDPRPLKSWLVKGRIPACGHGLLSGQWGRAPFRWYETAPVLLQKGAVEKLVAMARQAEASLMEEFGLPLGLVIIDTIVASAGYPQSGAENDPAIGQALMNVLKEAAQQLSCFVLGIDHYGKDITAGTRGTSAKEASADVVLACLGVREQSGRVTDTRLAVRKCRGGPQGEEFFFTVRKVEDPTPDEDGDPIITLVVDWTNGPGPELAPEI
jgi:hypothetical protein